MKHTILASLEKYRDDLRNLKKAVNSLETDTVNKKKLREEADRLANYWVEELRSPLEHKFRLEKELIQSTSEHIKRLHVLSRPSNLKTSYITCINSILSKYDDKFILPIKQSTQVLETKFDLKKLIPGLTDPDESDYLKEAIDCANAGYHRASVVMGWCAAISRIQAKIVSIGLESFNNASTTVKNKTTGKFKRWNKEFNCTTVGELQTVFDTDLIIILEGGLGLIDGNQAQRLETCFQYRNHSGHPGQAPIEEPHLVVFLQILTISFSRIQNSHCRTSVICL